MRRVSSSFDDSTFDEVAPSPGASTASGRITHTILEVPLLQQSNTDETSRPLRSGYEAARPPPLGSLRPTADELQTTERSVTPIVPSARSILTASSAAATTVAKQPALSDGVVAKPATGDAEKAPPPPAFDATVNDGVPKDLVRRDVVLVKNLDLGAMPKAKGITRLKQPKQTTLETLVAVAVLFNAVSTLMIINTSFATGVPAADRNTFGSRTLFTLLTSMVTYCPLVFLLIVHLMGNNAFSELSFYSCLKRGCILDFPESGTPKFILSSGMGLAFAIFFVWYFALALGTFIVYKASIGVVVIFCNNLVIGVGLAWYRQQSIESRFISLSDFVQAFPDRAGEFGNIDEVSLHWAASFLRGVTLAEAAHPSYYGSMRRLLWRLHGVPESKKILHHAAVFGTIAVLAGICVVYFQVLQAVEARQRWTDRIVPCARACIASSERSAAAWAVALAPATFTSQPSCHSCICECITAMGYAQKEVLSDCSEYMPDDIRFCAGAQSTCPTSCL